MDALTVSNLFLWVALIVLATVVLALARQIGVLHERIAPAGALMQSGGIKPGEAMPDLALPQLAGGSVRVADFAARSRGVLLFFMSPTCPLCASLLPVVQRIANEERRWLDLVLASDGGTRDEHERYVRTKELGAYPYVLSQELGMALQVNKLPYAALVNTRGVLAAKGLVNTREHLESLLEAERMGVAHLNQYLAATQREEEKTS